MLFVFDSILFCFLLGCCVFVLPFFFLADSSNTGVKHSKSSDHPLLLPCFDSAVSPPADFSEELGDSIHRWPKSRNAGPSSTENRSKKKESGAKTW